MPKTVWGETWEETPGVAYKVVEADFGSARFSNGRKFYKPGSTVETDHPVGLHAYRHIGAAYRNAGFTSRSLYYILELSYDEADVIDRYGERMHLRRLKVERVICDNAKK